MTVTGPAALPEAERLLRRSVTVYVNSFEQLTYLRNMLDWLGHHGFGRVVVLDQDSQFEPLLDYYASDDFAQKATLHRLGRNIGPRDALAALPEVYARHAMHVFTDPDLALPDPPAPDFLTRLVALAMQHQAQKVGLALDLSDAALFHDRKVRFSKFRPEGTVVEWETQFWEHPVAPDVYAAKVDTTFHLFNPFARLGLANRLRRLRGRKQRPVHLRVAGPGFTARHLPWYRDDGQDDAERAHYLARAARWSNWVA